MGSSGLTMLGILSAPVVLCLGLIYNTAGQQSCTWTYGHSCYNLVEQPLGFYDAENMCNIKHSGHLIAITSEDESNFLTVKLLKYYNACNGWKLWIGGYQVGAEWRWTSSYEDWEFTNWNIYEPNGSGNQCLGVYGDYKGEWFDDVCEAPLHFICESVIH